MATQCTFQVVSTLFSQEECQSVYGIEAVDRKTGKTVVRLADICVDHQAVEGLAGRMNAGTLCPWQMRDVVEDFLEECYGVSWC